MPRAACGTPRLGVSSAPRTRARADVLLLHFYVAVTSLDYKEARGKALSPRPVVARHPHGAPAAPASSRRARAGRRPRRLRCSTCCPRCLSSAAAAASRSAAAGATRWTRCSERSRGDARTARRTTFSWRVAAPVDRSLPDPAARPGLKAPLHPPTRLPSQHSDQSAAERAAVLGRARADGGAHFAAPRCSPPRSGSAQWETREPGRHGGTGLLVLTDAALPSAALGEPHIGVRGAARRRCRPGGATDAGTSLGGSAALSAHRRQTWC